MSLAIYICAGLVSGFLAGLGVGGGTLLIIFMAYALALPQSVCQGINLLFFLPVSLCALFFHYKNGLICKRAVVFSLIFGVFTCIIAALLATSLQGTLLRKVFGGFLIIVGMTELLKK